MTVLFGILPPVMAWQLRRKAQRRREQQPEAPLAAAGTEQEDAGVAQPWWQQHADMVPGGAPLLAGLFSAALAIQLSKLAADASLTSEGGGYFQVRGAAGQQTSVVGCCEQAAAVLLLWDCALWCSS